MDANREDGGAAAPGRERELPLQQLAREFKLSSAELRFAQTFYETASNLEAAGRLRISSGMGRQHLTKIAQKTGVKGQVQVMKGLCHLALTGTWTT